MQSDDSDTQLTAIEAQFDSGDATQVRDSLLARLNGSELTLIQRLNSVDEPLEREKINELLVAVAAAQQTVQVVAARLIKLKRLRDMQR